MSTTEPTHGTPHQAAEAAEAAALLALSMWTVYQRPKDFPESFVARRWEIGQGTATATDEALIAPTLEAVRDALMNMNPQGLFCMPRQINDDPCIVETWF